MPLRLYIEGGSGDTREVDHPYRLRVPGDGVVQRVDAPNSSFAALALDLAPGGSEFPEGFVLIGGYESVLSPPPASCPEAGAASGAVVYQAVSSGMGMAPLIGTALIDGIVVCTPNSIDHASFTDAVLDVGFDRKGRFHTVIQERAHEQNIENGQDIARYFGNLIIEQSNTRRQPCSLDARDVDYPFQVRSVETGEMVRSPSSRLLAVREADQEPGDIWLFGSDGGVARVIDNCRESDGMNVMPDYQRFFYSRDNSDLPSNSVLAMAEGADSVVWFGTSLGLARLQDDRFTVVPFDRKLDISADAITTLESFFKEVSEANGTSLSSNTLSKLRLE